MVVFFLPSQDKGRQGFNKITIRILSTKSVPTVNTFYNKSNYQNEFYLQTQNSFCQIQHFPIVDVKYVEKNDLKENLYY